jgi:hypothetical protein
MPIDDPVRTAIEHARSDLEESNRFLEVARRLGFSGIAAAALSGMPFVSQVITSLFTNSSARFEERFLVIAEALESQQKRFERDIPDRAYYSSDEFTTLMHLVLERIHSTHQKDKLSAFGRALGNSGRREFERADREQFVRVLRDLSVAELHALQEVVAFENSPAWKVSPHGIEMPSAPEWARLASLGLLQEKSLLRKLNLQVPSVPLSRQSPEGYARGLGEALSRYLEKAPITICRASGFGKRFLEFVVDEHRTVEVPSSARTTE